jgi:hypothetical protein
VPNRKMFACRLSSQAMVDLDRLVAALQKRSHAGRVSQADAIAYAVARAVAELDDEDDRTRQAEEKARRLTSWEERRAEVERNRLAKKPGMITVAAKVIESEPGPPRVTRVTYSEPDPPTPLEVLFPTKKGE